MGSAEWKFASSKAGWEGKKGLPALVKVSTCGCCRKKIWDGWQQSAVRGYSVWVGAGMQG